jgi:hypothetical protein
MTDELREIKINSFDPLAIEIPNVEAFNGWFSIVFPPLKVKLKDLTPIVGFGDLLPGACLMSEGRFLSYKVSFDGTLERKDAVMAIVAIADKLQEVYDLYQEKLDEMGFLLDGND